uniref:Ste24 endopeptidase n=1 Tax=Globodera pallida TaxID=36090 RepID=A0A183BK91_GLOPA
MEPDTIFWSLYAFYLCSSAWDVYLSVRQFALYRRTTARPASVEAIISESDFDKARAYQLDKMHFAFITDAFNFVLYSIVFLCTLYPSIWTFCSGIALWVWPGSGEIWHSVVFVLLCSIAETAISLPFSYYSTFYIEQRYGFNKETIPFFFKDRALKLGVSLALSTPVVALLIWIIRHGGENFHIYAWAALSVIIFVMMFIYPEFIAPLFDKYTPLPDSELKRKIEALASQVEFPLAKLYVVENSKRSTHSNAYMYGFWKNKRYCVCGVFDTLLSKEMNELMKQSEEEGKSEHKKAEEKTENEVEHGDDETTNDANNLEEKQPLLNTDEEKDDGKNVTAEEKERRIGMDDDEVVAVLGHELGHWKLCHSMALLAITEFNLLFTLFVFSVFYQQESLFTAFGFPPAEQQQQQPILIGLLLIGQFVMAPYTEFLSLAINVFTRKFEFAADRFSATLGHAPKLCSGLIKLGKDNLSLPIDDWLYSWCNHSHPPTPERMEALKKFE